MLYLEDDDPVSAELHIKKAATLIAQNTVSSMCELWSGANGRWGYWMDGCITPGSQGKAQILQDTKSCKGSATRLNELVELWTVLASWKAACHTIRASCSLLQHPLVLFAAPQMVSSLTHSGALALAYR